MNQMINPAPEQQEWQPTIGREIFLRKLKVYRDYPSRYSQPEIDEIKQHADYYGMPIYDGDFSIVEAIKQAGAGIVEGFSTANIADHPDNEYEAIARNIGHLVGFAPGILSKPLSMFGTVGKRMAAQAGAIKSLPMMGADWVTKRAKKLATTSIKSATVGRQGAFKTASNFLLGNKIKHITEGALHLGVASGISSWQGGIDEIVQGFIGGAQAGGVFRLIGNVVKLGDPKASGMVRGLAGSLFMGLPSTMRGATTPEQVYEYLMGAYFGANEVSWAKARAVKFMKTMEEKAQDDPKFRVAMDPTEMARFHQLPKEVQPIVKEMATKAYLEGQERRAMGYLLAQQVGNEEMITGEIKTLAGFEATGEYTESGKTYKLTAETDHRITSGGGDYVDSIFSDVGNDYGFPTIIFTSNDLKASGHGFRRILNRAELWEADKALHKANETIGRQRYESLKEGSEKDLNKVRRKYYIVKNADALYAVGNFTSKRKAGKKTPEVKANQTVYGDTGWAVQMAVDMKKPVHVYSPKTESWYTYRPSQNRFVMRTAKGKELPPKPPKHFAATGTEGIDVMGKPRRSIKVREAIEKLFDKYYQKTEEGLLREYTKKTTKPDKSPPIKIHPNKGGLTFLDPSAFDPIKYQGDQFNSLEGAYNAWKTGIKDTSQEWQKLYGNQVRELGATLKPKTTKDANIKLMKKLIKARIEQSPKFKDMILQSGEIEYPIADKFWKKKYPELLKELKKEYKPKEQKEKLKKIEVKRMGKRPEGAENLTEKELTQLQRIEEKIKNLEDEHTKTIDEIEKNRDVKGEPIDKELDKELYEVADNFREQLLKYTVERTKLFNKGEIIRDRVRNKRVRDMDEENSMIDSILENDSTPIEAVTLERRAIRFVNDFIPRHYWEDGTSNFAERNENKARIIQKVQDMIDEGGYIVKGSKENHADKLLADIANEFKINPYNNNEAYGALRQWITTENLGRDVKHLQAEFRMGGKTKTGNSEFGITGIFHMAEKGKPVSLSGKRKMQRAPEKLIEQVAKQAGLTDSDVYAVLDHVSVKKDGYYVDKDISRFRSDISEKQWNKTIATWMKYMDSEKGGGWYIYGGNADKDRLLFMKYHPKTPTESVTINAKFKQLASFLDTQNKYYLKVAEQDFINSKANPKKLGDASKLADIFRKSYISNILYDLGMNGFKESPGNIKKLFGPGFIFGSKDFNKRQQIWFTDSWPAAPEKIREYVRDLYLENNVIKTDNKGQVIYSTTYMNTGKQAAEKGAHLKYIITPDLSTAIKKLMEPDKQYSWDVERLATELEEHHDGGAIVRDDVITGVNAEFGMPVSGQNKSFIVSPDAEHGALLGKYMFHIAGSTMSEMMRKAGLHMILPESAVKQQGTRKSVEYKINPKAGKIEYNLKEDGQTTEYYLPIEDIRGNFSVKQDKHMMEDQAMPKQVLINLAPFTFSGIQQGVIDDMFESIIAENFKGVNEANDLVNSYLKQAEDGEASKNLSSLEGDIARNLNKVGIHKLLDIIKGNHTESLSATVYSQLLKINKRMLKEDMIERNITGDEYKEQMEAMEEAQHATDRHIKAAFRWAKEARAKGTENANAFATLMHNYIRDFRLTAVKNFITQRVIRPKMGNSIASVMRPYDKALQMDLDNVNPHLLKLNQKGIVDKILGKDVKADEIFFLDDMYRERRIKHGIEGEGMEELNTLGKLWDFYEDKKTKMSEGHVQEIEDFFRALTVRVPMDALSGVQIVHFRGFTGRAGHGLLLHPRAMKAEGGADLDGDKSFIFFGGKDGIKPEWKEAYYNQKEEFYFDEIGKNNNKTGRTLVGDNKYAIINTGPFKGKTYHELLTLEADEALKNRLNSKAYQYNIDERMRISMAAVDGRNQLGPVASSLQIMNSTWNALMAASDEKDKTDTFTTSIKVWPKKRNGDPRVKTKPKIINLKLTIAPRATNDDISYQSGMNRAQMGLSSDPMDELGLTGKDVWFQHLWNAYFKVNSMKFLNGKGQWVTPSMSMRKDIIEPKLHGRALKEGLFKNFSDINQAYWGRDWTNDAAYKDYQIQELGRSAFRLSEIAGYDNTMLSKIGIQLAGIDWSDGFFNRIDRKKVRELYDRHLDLFENKQWLKRVLGRSSIAVNQGPYIEKIFDNRYNLYDTVELERMAKPINKKKFFEIIKGTKFTHDKRMKEAVKDYAEKERIDILRDFRRTAEEMLVNDIEDMNTASILHEIVEPIVTKQQKLLNGYTLKDGTTVFGEVVESRGNELIIQQGKGNNVTFKKINKKNIALDIKSEIDIILDKAQWFKANSWLKARERRQTTTFVDQLNQENKTPFTPEMMKLIKEKWADTDIGRLVLEGQKKTPTEDRSALMDQIEIDKEMKQFKRNLTDVGKELFDHAVLGTFHHADISEIDKYIKVNPKLTKLDYDLLHAMRMEGAKTSTSKLGYLSQEISDKAVQRHVGAFNDKFSETYSKDIKKKVEKTIESEENLPPEIAEKIGLPTGNEDIVLQRMQELTGYEGLEPNELSRENKSIVAEIATIVKHEGNHVASNLNEILRGVIGKDLNAMNKQDFITFRNYLNDIKSGSIWQRIFSKDKATKLSKRHWWLFPRAVNQELMRDDLRLLESRGMYANIMGEVQEGKIYIPTHYIGSMQRYIGLANDEAVNMGDELIKRMRESLNFVNEFNDGERLRQIAVAHRAKKYGIRLARSSKGSDKSAAINYFKRTATVEKELNWSQLKKNHYTITVDGERVIKKGQEIVHIINNRYTEIFRDARQLIEGDPEYLKQFIHPLSGQMQYSKMVSTVVKDWEAGHVNEAYWRAFGIQGLRSIARTMMLEMIPDKQIKYKKAREGISKVGEIVSEEYWPQMMFDRKGADTAKKAEIKKIVEEKISTEEKDKKLAKLMYKYRALDGEWNFQDLDEWNMADNIKEQIAEQKAGRDVKVHFFNADEQSAFLQPRDAHLEGWTLDAAAPEAYLRSLSQVFFRQLGQIIARNELDAMGRKMLPKWGKTQTKAWQNYAKLYVQDALGNPSVVPKHLVDTPYMKLKGTPYAWWSDNNIKDKVNKLLKSAGLTDKELPEALQGIDYSTLRHLSNLEAQFEMASLLAHPKSVVGNVFGGTTHTIQSAGWQNFKNARKIKYLRGINPEWKSMADVDNFVVRSGVYPDFLVYEYGLHRELQSGRNKQFIEDVSKKLSRHPEMESEGVFRLAKKHGITGAVVDFAAKFMSVPERVIRRDAFMSHYLQQWNKWGGAFPRYDHPYILRMAKKGVQATQFLYSATYRPAFARTALGKVMSRFQLWGWNAVRFRNDVINEAKIYGLRPGSASYDKFKRMAQIDLFVFALANVFAFSLFDNTLPAPWNWFQDTAEWIFGDEKGRNKAFFGAWPTKVAPLQLITPPALRLLGPSIRALIDDDWRRIAEYHAWTMFPFGRMAKDLAGPNNLIENPIKLLEKLGGIPLGDLQRMAKEIKEDKYKNQLFLGSYKNKETL